MNVTPSKMLIVLALGIGLVSQVQAHATAVTINFDVDTIGNAINAPSLFASTTRLTTLYSSLGVTFAGPGGNDGGAILDQAGNFGVNALSGTNFLSFNINATMSDGGVPRGPETLMFSPPVTSVSVFGGDFDPVTLQMQAFNSLNQLVATDTQTAAANSYTHLNVAGGSISRVTLDRASGSTFWAFDDLTFTPVPEPSTLTLAALAALSALALLGDGRRRKRRTA